MKIHLRLSRRGSCLTLIPFGMEFDDPSIFTSALNTGSMPGRSFSKAIENSNVHQLVPAEVLAVFGRALIVAKFL